MKYVATLNGKKYEVEIEKVVDYQPLTHEQAIAPTFTPAPISTPVSAPTPVQAPVQIQTTSKTPTSQPATTSELASTSMSTGGSEVLSPMPGSIFEIKVAAGQKVKFGQVLFILEAMKMENEIVAPADGTVASMLVKKGDVVDTDAVLAIIK